MTSSVVDCYADAFESHFKKVLSTIDNSSHTRLSDSLAHFHSFRLVLARQLISVLIDTTSNVNKTLNTAFTSSIAYESMFAQYKSRESSVLGYLKQNTDSNDLVTEMAYLVYKQRKIILTADPNSAVMSGIGQDSDYYFSLNVVRELSTYPLWMPDSSQVATPAIVTKQSLSVMSWILKTMTGQDSADLFIPGLDSDQKITSVSSSSAGSLSLIPTTYGFASVNIYGYGYGNNYFAEQQVFASLDSGADRIVACTIVGTNQATNATTSPATLSEGSLATSIYYYNPSNLNMLLITGISSQQGFNWINLANMAQSSQSAASINIYFFSNSNSQSSQIISAVALFTAPLHVVNPFSTATATVNNAVIVRISDIADPPNDFYYYYDPNIQNILPGGYSGANFDFTFRTLNLRPCFWLQNITNPSYLLNTGFFVASSVGLAWANATSYAPSFSYNSAAITTALPVVGWPGDNFTMTLSNATSPNICIPACKLINLTLTILEVCVQSVSTYQLLHLPTFTMSWTDYNGTTKNVYFFYYAGVCYVGSNALFGLTADGATYTPVPGSNAYSRFIMTASQDNLSPPYNLSSLPTGTMASAAFTFVNTANSSWSVATTNSSGQVTVGALVQSNPSQTYSVIANPYISATTAQTFLSASTISATPNSSFNIRQNGDVTLATITIQIPNSAHGFIGYGTIFASNITVWVPLGDTGPNPTCTPLPNPYMMRLDYYLASGAFDYSRYFVLWYATCVECTQQNISVASNGKTAILTSSGSSLGLVAISPNSFPFVNMASYNWNSNTLNSNGTTNVGPVISNSSLTTATHIITPTTQLHASSVQPFYSNATIYSAPNASFNLTLNG